MRLALLLLTTAVFVSIVVFAAAWHRPVPAPFGFTQAGAIRQAALEQRFLRLPSPERIRETHRFLTAAPHLAGSARDWELAEHVRDQFVGFGFDEVTIATHDVLLPWPT
jgi:N-acetylated-alpha-linked acidic dipeptidase